MASKRGVIYPIPQGMDVFEEHELKKLNKNGKFTDEQLRMIESMNNFQPKVPMLNEPITARYIGRENGYFILDGGFKDYIRVEDKPSEAKYFDTINIGQTIDVNVDYFTEHPFVVLGSVTSLAERNAKKILLQKQENGEELVATAIEMLSGGYKVEIEVNKIPFIAFMPHTLADVNRMLEPETLVGQTFKVLIDNDNLVDDTNVNYTSIIVSRKAYLESLIPQKIKTLSKNTPYTGVVTGTTNFGVFVQFEDYLTGMIHISCIDEQYRDKLNEIQAGTEIVFYVKDAVKVKGGYKIMLSQYLHDSLIDSLEKGVVLTGNVIQVQKYGTLVAFDDDTKGLIPSAELNSKQVTLKVGQNVVVKIEEIERESRRMTLSLT